MKSLLLTSLFKIPTVTIYIQTCSFEYHTVQTLNMICLPQGNDTAMHGERDESASFYFVHTDRFSASGM